MRRQLCSILLNLRLQIASLFYFLFILYYAERIETDVIPNEVNIYIKSATICPANGFVIVNVE